MDLPLKTLCALLVFREIESELGLKVPSGQPGRWRFEGFGDNALCEYGTGKVTIADPVDSTIVQ